MRLPVCVLVACALLVPKATAQAPTRRFSRPQPGATQAQSVYARWLAGHFESPDALSPSGPSAAASFTSLAITSLEISSDTSSGSYRQTQPAAALTGTNLLAFWLDEKDGVPEIRARRFAPDLSALGVEFALFNDGVVRVPDQLSCTDNGRTAALSWLNESPYAIRIALVDSLGTVIQENTAGAPSPPFVGSPGLSSLSDAGFLAVWEEFRLGWRIMGQKYDSVGAPSGSDFAIDGQADSLLKTSPAVAGDTAGGFCVTWSQGDNSRADVYVRCFNALGAPMSAALKLTTEIGGESYMLPQVVYVAAIHRYVVEYVRADLPPDSTSLWKAVIHPNGTLAVAPAALPAGPYPWRPHAATSGARVVTYTERFDNLSEIRSLAMDAAGAVVESTAVISAGAVRERASVRSTSGSDTLCVVWQDRQSGDFDIYGLTRAGGVPVAAERVLQTEGPGGQQTDADVSRRFGSGALVVYRDMQSEGDIALAEVSEAGAVLARRRASDDTLLAPQYDPHIATTTSGWSLVTWTDERSDWPGAVHAAGRFAQAGLFTAPSFRLDSTGSVSFAGQTDAAMRDDKTSAAVWVDDRSGPPRAYMRRFTATGTAAGATAALEDGSQSQLVISFEQDPVIAMDSTGNVWTAWTAYDLITQSYYVLVQSWSAVGRRGTNFLPSGLGPTLAPLDYDLAALPGAHVRLVWFDPSGSSAVKTALFDTLGATTDGPDLVSASLVSASGPRVALDVTGRWVVAWAQAGASTDEIAWQRYEADGTTPTPIEKISNTQPATRRAPAVAYSGAYVYGAWHDNEFAGKGFDVRLSSLLKATSDIGDDTDPLRPEAFELNPSYPNPFNGSARISYTLDAPSFVTLAVFDALGRRVRMLAQGVQVPGRHEVTWNGKDDQGKDLASGVYFYRLVAGAHSNTRKLLYLK